MEESHNTVNAINEVKAQLDEFPDLREEFILLLSRKLQSEPEQVRQGSPQSWATLLVLEAKRGG